MNTETSSFYDYDGANSRIPCVLNSIPSMNHTANTMSGDLHAAL